jgi:archaellum component FlaC
MCEQEELMDNILDVDLEIVETVRTLQQENWNTEELKNQVTDLLKIHDELVGKIRSLQGDDHPCDCGHDHN